MGGCESAELRTQFAKSRDIDKELKKIPNNFQQKLLLLGPGESGKSTCLKQMQILNSHGFSDAELEDKKIIVYLNTIQNMVVLVEEMEKRGISFKSAACKSDAGLLRKRAEVKEILMFTPEVRDAIKRLWADEGVRQCYEARSDFQFVDSAVFFFEEIDRVSEEGFRPTPEDILHTRVATSGVVQVNFTIKNINFEVYDVGGQRSERRKWIHCFDDVNGIIFVAAISEYDQRIREDNRTNRLTEALELYDNVLNARFFDRASSILFLNKKDLFAAKITRTSLKICFPTYKGGLNYEDGIRHIKKEFNRLVKRDKKVYIHETCATDTNQVQVVINSVIDTIIQENLKDTGMI